MNTRQRKALEAIVELGCEPSGELGGGELARRIGMSKDSVHQLLLPLVRAGLLVAARGRSGGYRGADALPAQRLSAVLELYDVKEPSRSRPGLRALAELEEAAERASAAVWATATVGGFLSRARAERGALTWEI